MTEQTNDQIKELLTASEGKAISFILCAEEKAHVCVNVTATISNGCLTVFGQDFGEIVKECWNTDEYEYWYEFDEENTKKLLSVLTAEGGDPVEEMTKRFSGMEGCKLLRELCAKEKILYRFGTSV